jgi:hypothetical protein
MGIQDHVTTRTPADGEAAAREEARIREERFDRQMKKLLPEGWTYGYIGNCGQGYDDRSWSIFVPHPGRVGQPEDRIGDLSTENRHQLLHIAIGIAYGRKMMAAGR